jgi:hypothetical protein
MNQKKKKKKKKKNKKNNQTVKCDIKKIFSLLIMFTGDETGVLIGFDTNIQDGTVISDYGKALNVDHDGSVHIGSHTTIGMFQFSKQNKKIGKNKRL